VLALSVVGKIVDQSNRGGGIVIRLLRWEERWRKNDATRKRAGPVPRDVLPTSAVGLEDTRRGGDVYILKKRGQEGEMPRGGTTPPYVAPEGEVEELTGGYVFSWEFRGRGPQKNKIRTGPRGRTTSTGRHRKRHKKKGSEGEIIPYPSIRRFHR